MYAVDIVLETGPQVRHFAPYVPAISNSGTVAVQAALTDGSHAVIVIPEVGEHVIHRREAIVSHPDLNAQEVCWLSPEGLCSSLGRHVPCDAGPLGPTMNARGDIVFRAGVEGRETVVLSQAAGTTHVLWRDDFSLGMEGLPVVDPSGAVVVRGREGERDALWRWRDGDWEEVIATGSRWLGLGRFPSVDSLGRILIAAYDAAGSAALRVDAGREEVLWRSSAEVPHLRGCLAGSDEMFWGIVASSEGTLGLAHVARGEALLAFAVGQTLLESEVTAMAANPVSSNKQGQVALRLELADGRELIVRLSPQVG